MTNTVLKKKIQLEVRVEVSGAWVGTGRGLHIYSFLTLVRVRRLFSSWKFIELNIYVHALFCMSYINF